MGFSMIDQQELQFHIDFIAKGHDLNPQLVAAMVMVESSGDHTAWNPEQKYRYFWDVKLWKPFRKVTDEENTSEFPPKDFHSLAGDADNEWWAQQASWGVMQVMGAVAREHGYRESYLTGLCRDVPTGLLFGCRVLQGHLRWAKGIVPQAVAAYNGGRVGNQTAPYRNAAYVEKVYAAMKR
jgi:hypothetical protein